VGIALGHQSTARVSGTCGLGLDLLGKPVDRVLPVQKGPQDPQPGWVGHELEGVYGVVDLIVRGNPSFLRIYAV
jgi:hypothetical protein